MQNVEKHPGGCDWWWLASDDEILPPSLKHSGTSNTGTVVQWCAPHRPTTGRTYRRGVDTMDVWFDSGSSWYASGGTVDGGASCFIDPHVSFGALNVLSQWRMCILKDRINTAAGFNRHS